MNLPIVRLLLLFLIYPFFPVTAQVNYEFCMTAKYGKTIVLDFKVHNNTSAPLNEYNFIFDWRGVSNAVMWSGLDVIQNGDRGIVELRKTTWGAALPIGTTVFSLTIDYENGMFPPDSGILNGAVINGITCYTPPAYENFDCERNFSAVCTVKPEGEIGKEIRIGEGNVYAWKAPMQIYIPDNRKSWAIGMAVSHSLLTNLAGFDIMSINEYFATAIQESNAGCEGSKLIAPEWVTINYPSHDTNNAVFCYDQSGAVAVGYFQQEMGGSWIEMDSNYPCFIPQISRNDFISNPSAGSSFEFQSIIKAYHDYRNIAYWQYVKCWNPIDFFKKASDPYASVKIIGMAYNQGMNHNSFEEIFKNNRENALSAANIMDQISPETPQATNRLYAEQINRLTKVLDNKVSEINWADAAVFGVTDRSAHSFRGFYDASYTWKEVEEYIKKIMPFYTSFGVEEKSFSAAIKSVFDSINGGKPISFRYQMSKVVEAIVINLPAFDPKKGLAEVYGGSGANSCFAPTARMEGFDAACGNDLSLKFFFSGKAPYTFTYKKIDSDREIVFTEITTSQNPYTVSPVEEGTYALTAIRDNTAAGEVVCKPVSVKHDITVSAKLSTYGNICDEISPGIVIDITSNVAGPYTIAYEIDGVQQPEVTLESSPYILAAAPAPAGRYHLKKVTAAGCEIALDETLMIEQAVLPVFTAKLLQYGGDSCSGTAAGVAVEFQSNRPGPYTIAYEIDGVLQPEVTLESSPYILAAAPAPAGSYHLRKVTAAGCEIGLDETLLIEQAVLPVFTAKLLQYGGDSCSGIAAGVAVEFQSNRTGPYTIAYEIDGVLQPEVTLESRPYILEAAPAPAGSYHLRKVTAGGCEIALDETLLIEQAVLPVFTAKLLQYGGDSCSGTAAGVAVEFQSNRTGPYTIAYEIDGVLQPEVTLESSPFTLAAAPAPAGRYHLKKVTAAGCEIALDETLLIEQAVLPVFTAKLLQYGGDSCSGTAAGVAVEFQSNRTGPYTIAYEIDGVLQPEVTLESSPFTLAAAPAPAGRYHLKKVTAAGCEIALDETLLIEQAVLPVFTAKLLQYGGDSCSGTAAGVAVEFQSNRTGPYIIAYEIDGVLQPELTLESSPYILAAAPAPAGSYHLRKVTAGGCEIALDETLLIEQAVLPVFTAKLLQFGGDSCSGTAAGVAVEFQSNRTGPYIIAYEIDGVLQPEVTLESSPFILAARPASAGRYHLKKVTVAGCEIALDETLLIEQAVLPVFTAKLLQYGGDSCSGIAAGVAVEFQSNRTGPYIIAYEIDGVLQPEVTLESSPYILAAAPALAGSYHLKKVTVAGCEIALDETMIIENLLPPVMTAHLQKYGEDFCQGISPGLKVVFTSSISGSGVLEYEINGILQPVVIMDSNPYVLIPKPAPVGKYHLKKISIEGCDFPLDEIVDIIKDTVPPLNDIKWVLYGEEPVTGRGPGLKVEFTSTAAGPYVLEYEKDGVIQTPVFMNGSPYTVVAAPAPTGIYRLKKISFGGCSFQLNQTVTIETSESPSIQAKLVLFGEIPCMMGPGVRLEIESNISGPYVIEYEINGLPQHPIITDDNFSVIAAAPALAGTYRLTKISKGASVFYFNHTVRIEKVKVPPTIYIEGKLAICQSFTTILQAVIDRPPDIADSYQWIKDGSYILGAEEKSLEVSAPGDYAVSITDNSGCSVVSKMVHVVVKTEKECEEGSLEPNYDYPKFFTPNGDGFNDSWHFKNFKNMNKVEIDIFDRYGKFLTHLTQNSPGWDGTYNNQPLYATDYWFVLTYEEQDNKGVKKMLRGHFSLKR